MKTVTVEFRYGFDQPKYFSLVPGHVDFDTFRKAFTAEWGERVQFLKDAPKHEWWVFEGEKWTPANEDHPNAVPVTVLEW